MLVSRLLPVAALALFSIAAIAQEAPPLAPAQAEAAPTMMQNDCTSQATRHDHGAERGTPAAKMAGCAMASPAASAATAKLKTKPAHDHGKVHKLM